MRNLVFTIIVKNKHSTTKGISVKSFKDDLLRHSFVPVCKIFLRLFLDYHNIYYDNQIIIVSVRELISPIQVCSCSNWSH